MEGDLMEDELHIMKMEENLNLVENGSRPQFSWKWKTTLFLLKKNLLKKDDLNILMNSKNIYIYITNCTAQHILQRNLTNKTN
jgi:hypothetical protein